MFKHHIEALWFIIILQRKESWNKITDSEQLKYYIGIIVLVVTTAVYVRKKTKHSMINNARLLCGTASSTSITDWSGCECRARACGPPTPRRATRSPINIPTAPPAAAPQVNITTLLRHTGTNKINIRFCSKNIITILFLNLKVGFHLKEWIYLTTVPLILSNKGTMMEGGCPVNTVSLMTIIFVGKQMELYKTITSY